LASFPGEGWDAQKATGLIDWPFFRTSSCGPATSRSSSGIAYASRPSPPSPLIVEVGRGYGNSTVVLTEVAHTLGVQVVSVDSDDQPRFESVTWPKLQPVVGDEWRLPLEVIHSDLRDLMPPACERCFLFWDVHGAEVAATCSTG
jgi:hypothetical protein